MLTTKVKKLKIQLRKETFSYFYVPFPAHWRSFPTATEASKMWV